MAASVCNSFGSGRDLVTLAVPTPAITSAGANVAADHPVAILRRRLHAKEITGPMSLVRQPQAPRQIHYACGSSQKTCPENLPSVSFESSRALRTRFTFESIVSGTEPRADPPEVIRPFPRCTVARLQLRPVRLRRRRCARVTSGWSIREPLRN